MIEFIKRARVRGRARIITLRRTGRIESISTARNRGELWKLAEADERERESKSLEGEEEEKEEVYGRERSFVSIVVGLE